PNPALLLPLRHINHTAGVMTDRDTSAPTATSGPHHTNRLIHEKSPYLRQHAHNPVDWYPWGPEAFAKAQAENKPIFLSIGYSTCHWCHVMEHESFENEAIAQQLNRDFVSIKVDREAQPDVDKVYMMFVQATTGGGGWPLSAFLAPDLTPFFGGTYFPPKDRFGTRGFPTILEYISEAWKANGSRLQASGRNIIGQLRSALAKKPAAAGGDGAEWEDDPAGKVAWKQPVAAYHKLAAAFDSREGGFSRAPKFPTPVAMDFLLGFNYYLARAGGPGAPLRLPPGSLDTLDEVQLEGIMRQLRVIELSDSVKVTTKASSPTATSAPDIHTPLAQQVQRELDNHRYVAAQALFMVRFTLRKLAAGGIHDHVGQGFHRYSVDGQWHVPHFEKMLYDQAQLTRTYLDAYCLTGDTTLADTARDILTYVARDLTHPDGGGFYSAEDADSLPTPDASAKTEGAFYVWRQEELVTVLGEPLAKLFAHHYGVESKGNVDPHADPHGELKGRNVLIRRHTLTGTLAYYRQELASKGQETAEKHTEPITLKDEVDLAKVLADARDRLAAYRNEHRPRPFRDEKVVVSWNGLMIGAAARAASILGDPAYLKMATRAATFVRTHLYDATTHQLRRHWYEGGAAPIDGFAEDYAFLIQGLLDLYEASLDEAWLTWACQLQATQDRLFWDDEAEGGYFHTAKPVKGGGSKGAATAAAENPEQLILRLKDDHDGAEPSYNSVAARNLLRLAGFFGTTGSSPSTTAASSETGANYQAHAERTLACFSDTLDDAPQSMPAMLVAVMQLLQGNQEIIVAGERDHPQTQAYLEYLHQGHFMPNRVLMLADPSSHGELAQGNGVVAEIMANHRRQDEGEEAIDTKVAPQVYICENSTCGLPLSSLKELKARLPV
ncbi:hypothetical protein IWQ60_009438, partial [Tieghemiomyces parasiticus]